MSEEATLNEFVSEQKKTSASTQTEILDEWQETSLIDLCEIGGGSTPKKSNEEYWEGGDILWTTPKDFTGPRLIDTEDKITKEGAEASASKIYPPSTTLLVVRSGVLRHTLPVAYVENQTTVNQDLKALQPDSEQVNPEYFFQALSGLSEDIRGSCKKTGTTVESIQTNVLKQYPIPVPPLKEQRKIASVLYTVDQAIQRTEEVIDQLDRFRQGLTQTLFLNGYRDCDNIVDAHHRNRLPQHPAAWETRSAKDVIEVTRGAHPRPKSDTSLWGGDIPMIKIGDRDRGDSRTITATEDTVTEKGSKSSKLVDEGTLIVSNAGTVGAARMIGMKACIHDHWLILRKYKDELSTRYLYHFINWNQDFLESLASGSTVLDLNTDDFRLFDITFPELEEQQEIADMLDSLHDEETKNQMYQDQLKRLKQGLMQDLLSGEVCTHDKDIKIIKEVL